MDSLVVGDINSSYDSDRDGPTESSNTTRATSTGLISNGALSHEENKFQSAISAWRNIDLTKLVPDLDDTATDIVTHQKDALLARKDLAQKTKDFRKLDDPTKLVEFKSLLKAYQTFIDLLTNHGKTTSSAFLRVYSSISEAPDPYPLLEASVDSLLLSEDTLPKLTAENEHLQKKINDLTQQLDSSDAQLEQERNVRKGLEDSRDVRIKEVESSWKAVIDEKKDNWEAKERSLEEKIESQERLLNELKASYEVNQRLGHDGGDVGENRQNSASAAELEIVSSDLDRTSQRLAEVEARNEQLRTELAEASSNTHASTQEDPNNARLRSENSSLLRKLDGIRLEKDTETRKRETRIRSLEKDAQKLDQERESLRERINSWRDYNEIKQELEIFKSIEFSTLDDDEDTTLDGEAEATQPNGTTKPPSKDSLEKLLLARNKKLSNDLTHLRVSHSSLQTTLASLQETLSATNADLERSQTLNATLETDLVKVQQEASNAFPPAMSTTGTHRPPPSNYPSSSFPSRRPGGRSSPTSSIISGFDPSRSASTLEAIRAGEPVGGGSGLLPMIQAQRDRFKQKNQSLETELAATHSTVSSLRQEVASLQKDNLNLYEKSRYISTYRPSTSSGNAYTSRPDNTSIATSDATSSGLSLSRYATTYEHNLTPFATFRSREATRAYRRLSLPERLVFSLSRTVLANRLGRNLFAFYCVALHLLVLGMLYWLQGVDVSRHASNLGQSVVAGAIAGNAAAGRRGGAGAGAGGGVGAGGGGGEAHGDWRQEGFIADPNA